VSLIGLGIVLPGLTVGLGGGLGYQVLRRKGRRARPAAVGWRIAEAVAVCLLDRHAGNRRDQKGEER
jgi:hypothetical protein